MSEKSNQPHDAGAGHVTSLHHVFRERAISLRTMEPRLRLITGLALAQLFAVVVLIAVSYTLVTAQVPVSFALSLSDQATVMMPLLVFSLSVIFLALAWSFLLAGACHARWPVRLLALGLFTGASLPPALQAGGRGSLGTVATLGVTVAIWLVSLATWLVDHSALARGAERWLHSRQVQLPTLALLFLPLLVFYSSGWWSGRKPDASLVTWSFTRQLGLLSVILVPVLFLAGTDWAEWGERTAARLAALPSGRRQPALLVTLTMVVAASILVSILFAPVLSVWPTGIVIWLSLAPVGALLPQLLLAGGAAVLLALFVWLLRVGHEWAEEIPIAAPAVSAVVIMLLFVGAGLAYNALPIDLEQSAFIQGVVALGGLTVAGAAGMLLIVRARLGRSGRLSSAALFMLIVGLLQGLRGLDLVAVLLFKVSPNHNPIPYVGTHAIQAGVALGTLVVLGWLALRRRPAPYLVELAALLLTLNVGLLILTWLSAIYDAAQKLSNASTMAQAIVILLAVLWDVTMSGKTITNVSGRLFPRHSRVLLYFGYIMLVSTAVLYFSGPWSDRAGEGINAAGWPRFETELWPQNGLVALGVPLLLSVFAIHAGQLLRGHLARHHEHAKEPAVAARADEVHAHDATKGGAIPAPAVGQRLAPSHGSPGLPWRGDASQRQSRQ